MIRRNSVFARRVLAGIRLLNGFVGVLAPDLIVKQLGIQASSRPAARYVVRMFGIRTLLIALDLLRPAGDVRGHAVHVAPIIHASDTLAATLAARSGLLPRRTARTIVAISGLNTLLSLLMRPSSDDQPAES